MSDDVLHEIQVLKQTLSVCSERLRQLEQRVRGAQPTATPPAASPLTPTVRSAPAASQRPRAVAKSSESVETRIGRDWLNRIGIASLVLGVVFFILYSFQYLGPAMKIATGFAIGGGLITGGVFLERRAAFRWYARGIIGGGWALIYFTTYAMHYIQAVRLIQQPWLGLILLAAAAAGAVAHSLRYHSETITGLALLLGFITTAVSDVTYFTLASSALLVLGLVWLVIRLRWTRLYFYGVVASYATYLLWIQPQIDVSRIVAGPFTNVAIAQCWLRIGFLAVYWLVYHAALFRLDESEQPRRQAMLSATLTNQLCFAQLVLLTMDPLYRDWRWAFLAVLGCVCVVSERVAQRRRLPAAASVLLLTGLSFLTLALPLKLTRRWVSFWWTGEVALLAWLGLRHARLWYRACAAVLAMIVFWRWIVWDLDKTSTVAVLQWLPHWRLLIGGLGVASLSAAAACYRWPRFKSVLHRCETHAFHVYGLAAAAMLWLLLMVEVREAWVGAAWALLATVIVGLGIRWRDRVLRAAGLMGAAVTAALVAVTMLGRLWGAFAAWWDWRAAACVVACLGAASRRYRQDVPGPRFAGEPWCQLGYTIAAATLLTLLLWVEVNHRWLSVAWAVEGVALVAWGFGERDRALRIAGLSVFGLLVLKILFVDLAGAETIYRILSFIVAGVMLLAASFAYARFDAKVSSRE